MEIKQGDTVRVSKDIPQFYRRYNSYRVFEVEHQVVDIEDGLALLDSIPSKYVTTIPTKYLVKVDAEAKEAKFKVGDKVIVHYPTGDSIGRIQEVMLDGTYDIDYGGGCTGHNITRSQIEPYTAPKYKVGNWVMISGVFNPQLNGMIGWISRIDKDSNKVSFQDGRFAIVEDKYLTLITQPTEQTEAEKKPYDGISEETANEISNMLEAYAKALSGIADSFDWQRYEANLAKEVALKVANKFNDPKEAAEYAVSVAKAVVEGLKKK